MDKCEERGANVVGSKELAAFLIQQIEGRHLYSNDAHTTCHAHCVSCAIIRAATETFSTTPEAETEEAI